MKKRTLLNVGKINSLEKIKEQYTMDLENENGVVIGGYSGTGKTNLIDHFRIQLLEQDYKLSNFVRYHRGHLLKLEKVNAENIEVETKEGQRLVFLRKHVKEIKRRKKLIDKANVTYDEYVANFVALKEQDEWKRTAIFIDDFSTNLMKMRTTTEKKYTDYLALLEYIITEGSNYGMKLFIVCLRYSNSDMPKQISSLMTCKISFMNPQKDLEVLGLFTEEIKTPKKIGELIIKSNTNEVAHGVKSYVIPY